MEFTPPTESELYTADLECLFSLAQGFLLSHHTGTTVLQEGTKTLKFLQTPAGVTLRFAEDISANNPLFLLQAHGPTTRAQNGTATHGVVAWSKDRPESATVAMRTIGEDGERDETSAVLLEAKRVTINAITDLLLTDAVAIPLDQTQATETVSASY